MTLGKHSGKDTTQRGEASAGVIGNKYYISLKDAKGRSHLFVYDATKGLWHREDGTKARYFTAFGGNLYYLEGNTIKTVSYLAASPLGQRAEPVIKKDGEIVVARGNNGFYIPDGGEQIYFQNRPEMRSFRRGRAGSLD